MPNLNLRLTDDLHANAQRTSRARQQTLQDFIASALRVATSPPSPAPNGDLPWPQPDRVEVQVPPVLNGFARGQHWIIAHPREKLAAKYHACGREVCWKSLDFERYRVRSARDPEWANRIEGGDLMATLLMNSRLKDTEAFALMGAVGSIERALADVPNARLEDTDLTQIRGPLKALFRSVRVGGVSAAKATKLLSLKRDGLIPMIDSQVLIFLYGRSWQFPSHAGEFADTMFDVIVMFKALLVWANETHSNLAALRYLSQQVSADLAVVTGNRLDVSATRCLDSLLWFDQWGYDYFGFRWNQAANVVEPDPAVRPRPVPDDPDSA